jgi:hypothetical protein
LGRETIFTTDVVVMAEVDRVGARFGERRGANPGLEAPAKEIF